MVKAYVRPEDYELVAGSGDELVGELLANRTTRELFLVGKDSTIQRIRGEAYYALLKHIDFSNVIIDPTDPDIPAGSDSLTNINKSSVLYYKDGSVPDVKNKSYNYVVYVIETDGTIQPYRLSFMTQIKDVEVSSTLHLHEYLGNLFVMTLDKQRVLDTISRTRESLINYKKIHNPQRILDDGVYVTNKIRNHVGLSSIFALGKTSTHNRIESLMNLLKSKELDNLEVNEFSIPVNITDKLSDHISSIENLKVDPSTNITRISSDIAYINGQLDSMAAVDGMEVTANKLKSEYNKLVDMSQTTSSYIKSEVALMVDNPTYNYCSGHVSDAERSMLSIAKEILEANHGGVDVSLGNIKKMWMYSDKPSFFVQTLDGVIYGIAKAGQFDFVDGSLQIGLYREINLTTFASSLELTVCSISGKIYSVTKGVDGAKNLTEYVYSGGVFVGTQISNYMTKYRVLPSGCLYLEDNPALAYTELKFHTDLTSGYLYNLLGGSTRYARYVRDFEVSYNGRVLAVVGDSSTALLYNGSTTTLIGEGRTKFFKDTSAGTYHLLNDMDFSEAETVTGVLDIRGLNEYMVGLVTGSGVRLVMHPAIRLHYRTGGTTIVNNGATYSDLRMNRSRFCIDTIVLIKINGLWCGMEFKPINPLKQTLINYKSDNFPSGEYVDSLDYLYDSADEPDMLIRSKNLFSNYDTFDKFLLPDDSIFLPVVVDGKNIVLGIRNILYAVDGVYNVMKDVVLDTPLIGLVVSDNDIDIYLCNESKGIGLLKNNVYNFTEVVKNVGGADVELMGVGFNRSVDIVLNSFNTFKAELDSINAGNTSALLKGTIIEYVSRLNTLRDRFSAEYSRYRERDCTGILSTQDPVDVRTIVLEVLGEPDIESFIDKIRDMLIMYKYREPANGPMIDVVLDKLKNPLASYGDTWKKCGSTCTETPIIPNSQARPKVWAYLPYTEIDIDARVTSAALSGFDTIRDLFDSVSSTEGILVATYSFNVRSFECAYGIIPYLSQFMICERSGTDSIIKFLHVNKSGTENHSVYTYDTVRTFHLTDTKADKIDFIGSKPSAIAEDLNKIFKLFVLAGNNLKICSRTGSILFDKDNIKDFAIVSNGDTSRPAHFGTTTIDEQVFARFGEKGYHKDYYISEEDIYHITGRHVSFFVLDELGTIIPLKETADGIVELDRSSIKTPNENLETVTFSKIYSSKYSRYAFPVDSDGRLYMLSKLTADGKYKLIRLTGRVSAFALDGTWYVPVYPTGVGGYTPRRPMESSLLDIFKVPHLNSTDVNYPDKVVKSVRFVYVGFLGYYVPVIIYEDGTAFSACTKDMNLFDFAGDIRDVYCDRDTLFAITNSGAIVRKNIYGNYTRAYDVEGDPVKVWLEEQDCTYLVKRHNHIESQFISTYGGIPSNFTECGRLLYTDGTLEHVKDYVRLKLPSSPGDAYVFANGVGNMYDIDYAVLDSLTITGSLLSNSILIKIALGGGSSTASPKSDIFTITKKDGTLKYEEFRKTESWFNSIFADRYKYKELLVIGRWYYGKEDQTVDYTDLVCDDINAFGRFKKTDVENHIPNYIPKDLSHYEFDYTLTVDERGAVGSDEFLENTPLESNYSVVSGFTFTSDLAPDDILIRTRMCGMLLDSMCSKLEEIYDMDVYSSAILTLTKTELALNRVYSKIGAATQISKEVASAIYADVCVMCESFKIGALDDVLRIMYDSVNASEDYSLAPNKDFDLLHLANTNLNTIYRRAESISEAVSSQVYVENEETPRASVEWLLDSAKKFKFKADNLLNLVLGTPNSTRKYSLYCKVARLIKYDFMTAMLSADNLCEDGYLINPKSYHDPYRSEEFYIKTHETLAGVTDVIPETALIRLIYREGNSVKFDAVLSIIKSLKGDQRIHDIAWYYMGAYLIASMGERILESAKNVVELKRYLNNNISVKSSIDEMSAIVDLILSYYTAYEMLCIE